MSNFSIATAKEQINSSCSGTDSLLRTISTIPTVSEYLFCLNIKLWMNNDFALNETNIAQLIVQKFLYQDEWKTGIMVDNRMIKAQDLSIEFKFKKTRLNLGNKSG